MEIATAVYPSQFLLLASLGNFSKAVGKGMGKPVFRVIQTHFAVSGNVGAVAAKEEVWEVCAQLTGYAMSVLVLEALQDTGEPELGTAAAAAVELGCLADNSLVWQEAWLLRNVRYLYPVCSELCASVICPVALVSYVQRKCVYLCKRSVAHEVLLACWSPLLLQAAGRRWWACGRWCRPSMLQPGTRHSASCASATSTRSEPACWCPHMCVGSRCPAYRNAINRNPCFKQCQRCSRV